MLFYFGIFAMIGSILLGFIAEGGNVIVLFQPYAALIIIGTGVGIFIVSNPRTLQRSIWINIKRLRNGTPYHREDYVGLLTFMFFFFRHAQTSGNLVLEKDIENPTQSPIFREFPDFLRKREALVFFCDYMRMLSMGFNRSYELETLMQDQINIRRNYTYEMSTALFKLADALPALGIIAAVLGVINAMSSVNQAPEILGHKIGAALLGTFIGIAVSYCVVAPLSYYLEKFGMEEAKLLECIKAGIISFLNGNTPIIAAEFARQTAPVNLKPSFLDLEKAIDKHRTNRKVKKHGR
jgi:chemotaxis protein MotA